MSLTWCYIIVLLGLMSSRNAIGQDFVLSDHTTIRSGSISASRTIAKGADGSVYSAGVFNGILIQGDDTLSTVFTDAVYLAKFNEDLSLNWIKKVAENALTISAYQARVAIDSDIQGNVLVGISYTGRLYFEGDTVGGDTAVGCILLRFDMNGQYIRSEPIEGEMISDRGVKCDPIGDVYLTGVSVRDIFVEKRSSTGLQIWRQMAGGPNNFDRGNVIVVDHLSNSYVAGQLTPSNSVYFDSIHVSFPLPAQHVSFVAKYDPMGIIQWVRYIYSTSFGNFSTFTAITFDSNGNPILAGSFSDSQLRFSNGFSSVGNQFAGNRSAFLTAFDATGNRLWVRISSTQDTGSDGASGLDTLGSTLVVLNGFTGTVSSGTNSMYSYGYEDIRVQQFDLSGNWISDFQIGGTSTELGRDLTVNNGAVYVLAGSASHPLHVGEALLDHPDASSTFLLKLGFGPNATGALAEESLLGLYPNPNNGRFMLQGLSGPARYSVCDLSGRLIAEGSTQGKDSEELFLSGALPGVYLLRLQNGPQTSVIRLVVQ